MTQSVSAKLTPEEPHEFGAEVEIARPASEVYPLLDFADPRNAKRQLGDRVEAVAGDPGRFELIVSELPDAIFSLTVTAQERDSEYAYTCVSTPTFGRVVRSHEHYRLEAIDDGGCRLILTNRVEFDAELSEDDYAIEAMMLTFSGFSAIEKIRLHAEEGVEAVKALSAAQLSGLDVLDGWPD